jgi:hypothetical protein
MDRRLASLKIKNFKKEIGSFKIFGANWRLPSISRTKNMV